MHDLVVDYLTEVGPPHSLNVPFATHVTDATSLVIETAAPNSGFRSSGFWEKGELEEWLWIRHVWCPGELLRRREDSGPNIYDKPNVKSLYYYADFVFSPDSCMLQLGPSLLNFDPKLNEYEINFISCGFGPGSSRA